MAIDQRRTVGFHVPRSATTLIMSLFKEEKALQDLAGSYSGSNTPERACSVGVRRRNHATDPL